VRGDRVWLGDRSTSLSGDLRTFALTLGRSPRKAVSYKELNEAVYDELYGQNTDRLRQLASELRRRLATLGLSPTNEYLPQGSRMGYLLMVAIEDRRPGTMVEPPAETGQDGPIPGRVTLEQACPYRGLDVFHEEDAPYFVGREAFSDELFRLVQTRSVVALVGASGSGKSSIVQAGLFPRLRSSWPAGPRWEAVTFAPGDDPFFALTSQLIPLLAPDLKPTDLVTERRRLAASLADGNVPLWDPFDEVRKCGDFERLLLAVDQFEELFTLTRPDLRRVFVDGLLKLSERDNTCVLLTLRADFYGHAIGLSRALSDQLGQAVVNVGAMQREELARAIRQPAAAVGLSFQAGLVDVILDEAGDEPGTLPLLEFALLQLWQDRSGVELTHDAFRAIGGVAGALARHADAVYHQLGTHEQEIARRVLLRLIVPGEGTNHTRQRVALVDLRSRDDLEDFERVVQTLADNRLLTTSRDALTGVRFADISHEALIHGWKTLGGWIEAERDWLREHHRLTEATREWRHTGDEEALYRGARLSDVVHLRSIHRGELSNDEEEFLTHSARLEARRERARYLGQAAGGGVGTGLGYGAAFALGFASTNPGPNGVVLTGATFAFFFAVGQITGFSIGIPLWLWRASWLPRVLTAVVLGAVVGAAGYLTFLRFLLGAEPTLVRASVGALVAGCLALGLAGSRRRRRRFQGAVLGGLLGTSAAVSVGGITWSEPVTLAAGIVLGTFSGAGFYLTSAEDPDRSF
jgi:hypothetical protein